MVFVSLSNSLSLKKFLSQEYNSPKYYHYINVTIMAIMIKDTVQILYVTNDKCYHNDNNSY